jgi:hypothetical protein
VSAALRAVEAAAHAAALLLALSRVRRRSRRFLRASRPLAVFLAATLAADGLRELLRAEVLSTASRPFTGWARAAFHVEQALFLAWSFGLAALAAAVFLDPCRRLPGFGRRAFAVTAAAWALVCLALASRYPELRGQQLLDAYGRATLACLIAAAIHAAAGAFLGPPLDRARRAALWLLVGDAAAVLGPYAGAPLNHWWLAQAASTAAYLFVAAELGPRKARRRR